MKNSIIRARCFFFTGCEEEPSVRGKTAPDGPGPGLSTYQADLRGHQVTQPVEPVDVGLQVAGSPLAEEALRGRRGAVSRAPAGGIHWDPAGQAHVAHAPARPCLDRR